MRKPNSTSLLQLGSGTHNTFTSFKFEAKAVVVKSVITLIDGSRTLLNILYVAKVSKWKHKTWST